MEEYIKRRFEDACREQDCTNRTRSLLAIWDELIGAELVRLGKPIGVKRHQREVAGRIGRVLAKVFANRPDTMDSEFWVLKADPTSNELVAYPRKYGPPFPLRNECGNCWTAKSLLVTGIPHKEKFPTKICYSYECPRCHVRWPGTTRHIHT